MESSELIERYLILLLGATDKPIPSDIHLQKEIFILTNFKKFLADEFNFQKHYFGPYSQVVEESIKNPAYFSDAFEFDGKKVFLSESGKKEFNDMINQFKEEKDFKIMLSSLKLIRNIYDKLTKDEFLFLVYETYPDYTEFSYISDKLTKQEYTRNKLLDSIFSKGLITTERYNELKNAS